MCVIVGYFGSNSVINLKKSLQLISHRVNRNNKCMITGIDPLVGKTYI